MNSDERLHLTWAFRGLGETRELAKDLAATERSYLLVWVLGSGTKGFNPELIQESLQLT